MKYEDADVCLFDPARHNLMMTRASLSEIGFAKIEMITDFAKFSEAIAKNSFDLVIAETHDAGGAIGELMRKIRAGEIGNNSFVVAITTSWDRDANHIQELVDCGVDDLLLRPFSTLQLRDRLSALVSNRKDFVVTSDYVGPDRRNDVTRKASSIKGFAPPNTLKAMIEGDVEAQSLAKEKITEAKANVAKERIRRLAMKIVVSMQVMIDDPAAGEALNMEEIDATARELRRRLRGHGVPDAVELAGALIEIATDLMEMEEHDAKQCQLVRELALGAYTAFAGGDVVEMDSTEIKNTVLSLRNKLQNRMISDFQSAPA